MKTDNSVSILLTRARRSHFFTNDLGLLYTRGMTYDDLLADDKTFDAVIHNLQIIGEATKQIPEAIRQKYPQIEWRKMAGLRDIIAHAYFNVNPKIVWNILTTKLKPLRDCVALIIQNEAW